MSKRTLWLLCTLFAFVLLAGCANAVIRVNQGEQIQAAINAASPGETIEINGGVYQESLVVDRSIILKGVSSDDGLPRVESDSGSAITIKADGVILEGLWAKSASGWTGDAGILVLSDDNLIRNNMASGCGNVGILIQEVRNNTVSGNVLQGNGNSGILLKNSSRNLFLKNKVSDNRYGCKLTGSEKNSIIDNVFLNNKFDAISLQDSHANLIERNYASGNDGALVVDNSRDNIVQGNDFEGNQKGIYLSYLSSSSDVQSKGKGVVISYSSMPSSESVTSNNSIYENNLSNQKNARDDSLNNWDNGKIGNNYSDFNDPAEGCKGNKICDSELSIPGGPSVDHYPEAAPVRVPGRSTGPGGAEMQIIGKSYLPGSRMNLNYTAPANKVVWVKLMAAGKEDRLEDAMLGQNNSGDVSFTAPEAVGSYRLIMHDENDTQLISLPFNVTVPSLSASPESVYTCEKITVAFKGAYGSKEDWIGMYSAGSQDPISRQMLGSREAGSVAFTASDAGSYIFKMCFGGNSEPVATSNGVEVKKTDGKKVVAEPSHVSPGGTVTVTFWGAPLSGTGVIGMYGMTRPDRFDLGKRPIGARSCGSMVWRLPTTPGQYDFRMFQDDINRPLLAQSNVVTVS
jgi:parallel beta-helix repeat protein